MKAFIRTTLSLLILTLGTAVFATNPISYEAYNTSTITVKEYMDMNFKQFESLSGQDLKFKDRMAFMATKKYLKNQMNSDYVESSDNFQEASDGFSFKFGAFLLGLLLGIVGLLIVVLLFSKPRRSAVISAVIGMVVTGVIVGLASV